MLIDLEYFVGELNIPNTSTQGVQERLNFFIAKYEVELLRTLLGEAFYQAYKTGITGAEEAIEQRWKDLRDGKTYTSSGMTYNWMGFRETSTKQSLIANYVYFQWNRDRATLTTEVGEVEPAADTPGGKKSSKIKIVRAWNEMVKWNRDLVMFLDLNTETYPEWQRQINIREHYNLLAPINVFGI